MLEVVLKRFDDPDETRNFEKGKLEIVRIVRMTIGIFLVLISTPLRLMKIIRHRRTIVFVNRI